MKKLNLLFTALLLLCCITATAHDFEVGGIYYNITDATNKTVTYTSSNPSVATVDASGNVTLVAAGETTITVSFAGNENYTAADDKTIEVTVSKIATEINIANATVNLEVKDPLPKTFIKELEKMVTVGDVMKYIEANQE